MNPLDRDKTKAVKRFSRFIRANLPDVNFSVFLSIKEDLTALEDLYGVTSKPGKKVPRSEFERLGLEYFDALWANSYGVKGEAHINAMSRFFCNGAASARKTDKASGRRVGVFADPYHIAGNSHSHIKRSLNY